MLVLAISPSESDYVSSLRSCTSLPLNKVFRGELVDFHGQFISRGVTQIITTRADILHLIFGPKASLSNYEGTLTKYKGVEVLFIPSPLMFHKVPHVPFLLKRYFSKISNPETWAKVPEFAWEKLTPKNFQEALTNLGEALFIGVDIETLRESCAIDSISWTGVFPSGEHKTYVLDINSMVDIQMMRDINWQTQGKKITQNGKYDLSYLCRFNAPLYNWFGDTASLFHSIYSELPKDLGSLAAFALREISYWKDLAKSPFRDTQLEYNGRDSWTTVYSWLSLLSYAPTWAIENYKKEFPVNYPAHLCEMTGVKFDLILREKAEKETQEEIDSLQSSLNAMLGVEANVNSPVQMKTLLRILGEKDVTSADSKSLAKAMYNHPLNARILTLVESIRKKRKLVSTYLTKGKDFNGRILYALNPHGTDTARLASKEHHFWCGMQIQNIPRGKNVKRLFIADPGFELFECDLEQAESRDTAFISGCVSLIEAVSGTRDFHSVNTSAFFGVPYESIYDDATGKQLNKELRDLGKRVNHGANYNMGARVLVETMGLEKIYSAAQLLKLPRNWNAVQIAEFLLGRFHATYPEITKLYYEAVKREIVLTKMISQKAIHAKRQEGKWITPTSDEWNCWTRYCFSDPTKSKMALNAYVAHSPQGLNAITLNKAFITTYNEISLVEKKDFMMFAQIHDSIFGQVREGRHDLVEKVVEIMQVPVRVKGADGIVRVFTVPSAAKSGGKRWSEL